MKKYFEITTVDELLDFVNSDLFTRYNVDKPLVEVEKINPDSIGVYNLLANEYITCSTANGSGLLLSPEGFVRFTRQDSTDHGNYLFSDKDPIVSLCESGSIYVTVFNDNLEYCESDMHLRKKIKNIIESSDLKYAISISSAVDVSEVIISKLKGLFGNDHVKYSVKCFPFTGNEVAYSVSACLFGKVVISTLYGFDWSDRNSIVGKDFQFYANESMGKIYDLLIINL